MKSSDLTTALQGMLLHEVLLDCYGLNGLRKCSKNTCSTPIDSIWTTAGITIQAGGYFAYDEVFPSTDHRCLWMDLSFTSAFGHTMPPIVWPSMRRLHCPDPRLIDNFNSTLYGLYKQCNMLQQVRDLDREAHLPLTPILAQKYKTLDSICCRCVAMAEKNCRRLRVGQVAFSPQ